jgi:hypothetical protein
MIFFKNTALIITLFTVGSTETRVASLTPANPISKPQSTPTNVVQPTIQPKPAPIEVPIIIPPVKEAAQAPQKRTNTWTSSAGLVYKSNKNLPNRINHVLEHAKAIPTKPTHSVFSVPEFEILDLIDEAWNKRGNPEVNLKPDTYIVDMGKVVGTKGQTKIKIIVTAGTSDIITAHPTQ